jgi:pilus assembly protein CpaC
MSKTHFLAGGCGTFAALCAAMALFAATPAHSAVSEYGSSITEPDRGESLIIELGRSRLLQTELPVTRVSVTQPTIADVQVLSPHQVLVMGLSVGLTDLLIWDEDDRAAQHNIEVIIDLQHLQDELARLFPESKLRVAQSRDVLLVEGSLRRAEDAALLRQYLDPTA